MTMTRPCDWQLTKLQTRPLMDPGNSVIALLPQDSDCKPWGFWESQLRQRTAKFRPFSLWMSPRIECSVLDTSLSFMQLLLSSSLVPFGIDWVPRLLQFAMLGGNACKLICCCWWCLPFTPRHLICDLRTIRNSSNTWHHNWMRCIENSKKCYRSGDTMHTATTSK